ncbi:MAG: amidohydrolase family protein [Actinomycetales bacterium]
MIIDCHGHYTTAPGQLQAFRDAQLAAADGAGAPAAQLADISDDEIRESLETTQLRLLRERGEDLMIFSPKASGMEHHVPDPGVAEQWARASNDLIGRITQLYPEHFVGVAQLPQTPGDVVRDGQGSGLDRVIGELRRAVTELGFVGCNLNPDPSGGFWAAPPLTDKAWYPLYETLVELDVPAMIHVSSSCNPVFHALGAHYLNADTTAFMQLVQGDLFADFPTLRFVIPHGGGAVPYHWGRFRGLADRLGKPPLAEHVMRNVFFDTAVYHQAGIDLLLAVIDHDNLLFASEMFGAVRGIDPETGRNFDDTKPFVDAVAMSDGDRAKIFEGNARRVYPRLDAVLAARRAAAPAGR